MKITDKFVFFQGGFDYLSRTHRTSFSYKDKNFNCCLQFITYCKAKLANQNDIAEKILAENNTRNLIQFDRELGAKLNHKQRKEWKQKREKYAFIAVREKFLQNPILLNKLLSTDNRELVEASTFGNYWGAGIQINQNNIEDKNTWKGQNKYGKIVTFIRDQIKLGNTHELNTMETLQEKKKKIKLK